MQQQEEIRNRLNLVGPTMHRGWRGASHIGLAPVGAGLDEARGWAGRCQAEEARWALDALVAVQARVNARRRLLLLEPGKQSTQRQGSATGGVM